MNKSFAVFSDVDGTIYGFPHKKLSEKVKEQVLDLSSKNIPFVINTGNPVLEKIKRLARELNSRYLSCSSGAIIYDMQEEKPLHIEIIDPNEAKKVWDLALKADVSLYYAGVNQFYLYNVHDDIYEFLTSFNEYDKWITDGTIPADLHRIEAYGTKEQLEKFVDLYNQSDIKLDLVNVDYLYIEMSNPGVNKGSGMKWLCENIFNADLADVMTIGDSPNDIPMFKLSGYSYAMDNSDQYTKSFAKYYTSDVLQDGLAEAIVDYLYRGDYELKRAVSQMGNIAKTNKKIMY
ncbi:Cof-type HAD-IIB family hydrolase [Mycoplasma sp. 1199]|uniref:Cof-type HAD-IIB family hydrolase n=1 Tax=Mycoplasma sp. 1199 TaxID=3108526 RepID=UPI002B1D65ED|nr:Cof-type HAD-IIB family hydrolase [Mycoplasma sp. 1199]MEA4205994.1 Cof-type HAD-IIB family hydrolase [Mycoplasma sp. 1199]